MSVTDEMSMAAKDAYIGLIGNVSVTKLVRRAALATLSMNSDPPRSTHRAAAVAEVKTLGFVAADILHICMAPAAFEIAVYEAVVAAGPFPARGVSREGVNPREAWLEAVRMDAVARLAKAGA